MDSAMTVLAIVAGLSSSLALGLLLEELLVGGLFRLVFARQEVRTKINPNH